MSRFSQAIDRVVEADKVLNEGHPQPFALPIHGLEAVVVGSVTALDHSDWWLPGWRERVGAVLRDVPLARLRDGTCGARPYRVAPSTDSPALRALYGVGIAHGNPNATTLVHLGIGSASDGAFHEALNLAVLLSAPIIFMVAVHPLDGDDAPLGTQLSCAPSALAKTFGLHTQVVDGQSAKAVHDAVVKARKLGGPHLIEATLNPGKPIQTKPNRKKSSKETQA